MDGPEAIASQEWIFGENPKLEYDLHAMKIHGVKWADIAKAPPEKERYTHVAAWLKENEAGGLPIASHYAVFDAAMYSEWVFRCGEYDKRANRFVQAKDLLSGAWHCTKRMASCKLELPNYKLDTVAERFGLKRSGEAHGALEDAILAGRVFDSLTKAETGETEGLK
jgi:DNA polymerase III epsilon subunit-like protein